MTDTRHHTLNNVHFPWLILTVLLAFAPATWAAPSPEADYDEEQIEIVEGEDRTIYEYRQNGLLTMIKIVPKNGGRAYYMVPADGATDFLGLDHKKKLYPQWVILEW